MEKFDYKLFVQKFLNNQLKDIEDQEISDKDINNILNEIENIQQDKFDCEQIINKLILNCSYCLPQITSSFLKIFVFNQINNHQACKNCCLYLYKQNQLF